MKKHKIFISFACFFLSIFFNPNPSLSGTTGQTGILPADGKSAVQIKDENPAGQVNVEEGWGEAVDEIVCAVKSIKDSFTNGETFEFDIIYKNVSDQPITVCTYRDYFYVWTQIHIIDSSGTCVASGQHGNGIRPPITISDFATLQPDQTTSVREVVESSFRDGENWPVPGKYTVNASINEINKMREHVIGFDEFCEKNNIKPWVGSVKSGTSTLLITSMPEIQWGQEIDGLQIGIRQAEFNNESVKIPVFFRNIRTDDKRYFSGADYEIILNNETYLSFQWQALNAQGLTVYPGQVRGPIWIDLADYVEESNRDKSYQAKRPLKKLPNGQFNLKVIYVGRNGNPRISSPDINFTVTDDSTWGEVAEGFK